MKGTKEQNSKNKIPNTNKGITLIALVITIIVMLILVAVTITTVVNGGLFEYASRAARETNSAIEAEQTLANGRIKVEGKWYASIDEYIAGNELVWEENKDNSFTNVKTGTTVKIGDYVNYDCGVDSYQGEWRVLGVEKGQLLLMSDDDVEKDYPLWDKDGYNNGVTYLDEICEEFTDREIAVSGRSIRIEDINKITGYNPTAVGGVEGAIYADGEHNEYGNKIKYWMEYHEEKEKYYVSYKTTNGLENADNELVTSFIHVDGTKLVTEEEYDEAEDKTGIAKEIIIECTDYEYYPNSLSESSTIDDENPVGIATNSPAYDMIFKNSDGSKSDFLIASQTKGCYDGIFAWGFHSIKDGYKDVHHCYSDWSYRSWYWSSIYPWC